MVNPKEFAPAIPARAAGLGEGSLASRAAMVLTVALLLGFAAHLAWVVDPWNQADPLHGLRRALWVLWPADASDAVFWAGSLAILAAQAALPAVAAQRVICRGLAVDVLYAAMMVPFVALVGPLYVAYLRFLLVDLAGIQPVRLAGGMGGVGGLLLGYLAADFLGWLHHLVRHKVAWFWRFHAVHHAQVEMNPFANERVHPVDWINAQTVRIVPALFFTDSLGLVLAYLAFHALLDRANHANLRINLGPLRWVFVTPQSHRIHHSADPAHHDCNFGVSLCIWDRLFGTQHPDDRSYPPTGVHDATFPRDRDRPWYAAPVTIALQVLHPFGLARGRG